MPHVVANGVNTYYEEHGSGEPLLLLHGGTASNETFARQIPEFAKHYRVIAAERRGHGRTADVDGPISFDLMTDDTIAFIEALGIERPHLYGHSDGAIIALMLAMRRPDLAGRIVASSGNMRPDGITPEFTAFVAAASGEVFAAAVPEIVEAYGRLSPDGIEHFGVVFEKIKRMWLNEPSLSETDLARITAPVLILVADHDAIRLEHAVELFQAIPNAQLAVIPGTGHGLHEEKPDLVNTVVLEFLGER